MILIFFIFGLFMGSFFLVVGSRWSNDESIVKPRSHCETCGHVLNWYELIPVLSYVFLNGKCRECKSHISLIYPAMEILTGIIFALSYYLFELSYEFVIMLSISSLSLITFVSDFKYMLILDIPLIVTCGIVLLVRILSGGINVFLSYLLSGFIMFLAMFLIKFLGDKWFKRESLGWGDVKLVFLFGITLGVTNSIVAIVIGAVLTYPMAIYSLVKKKMKEIPFGPFLLMGLMICFVFKTEIGNLLDVLLYIK